MVATVVECTGTGEGVEAGFRQAFLEGVRLTTMDSDRRLHCLSRNPILKLEAISSSSSSSSSQIIGGTTRLTPVSGSWLEDEEDENDEEDGADEENMDARGRVLTLRR